MDLNQSLFDRAQELIPGGVNSPVRAFRSVGGAPRFIERAKGPYMCDVEGKAFIDYVLSWGPMILGHNNPEVVDAVKAAINQMELNPNFNAGRGAVFTSEGKNELDSSIMDGKTLSAGAVAGVTNVKHPINCADLVRTKSPHVMMATKGAEEFCAKNGAETVDPKWFFTDFRYQQLQKAKEKEQIILDHDGDHLKTANAELFIDPMMYDDK